MTDPPLQAMRKPLLPIALWVLSVAASLWVVVHARYSADMSAFLPRAPTEAQQLLVEQLQNGVAARLLLIAVDGADATARAAQSRCLAATLRGATEFVYVTNGAAVDAARDRAFVFAHRYQLSASVDAAHFSADGLHAALLDDLELMQSPAGLLAQDMLRSDPTGETLSIVDRLAAAAPHSLQGVWASRDGTRALLIAETRADGADTDGQAGAIARLRAADTACLARAAGVRPQLILSGPGLFAVEARARIEHEALRLSACSSALIVLLLLCVYRSLPALLLGLLPVACGALAGVAAVALGFGVVHGITLGFGITLIGEAVDYSVYLFIQARGAGRAASAATLHTALWPTIGLGMLTSVCGFASLLPSAFPGLAQLGAYSIAGLVAAAAVTRYVLPQLLPARLPMADLTPAGRRIARCIARLQAPITYAALGVVTAAAVALLCMHSGPFWNRDLAALSPVPADAQRLDAQLRADLGAPDVGNLVVAGADDAQSALRLAEAVGLRLDALRTAGQLAGYDSPAHYLPSNATQAARQAALPDSATLRARLETASADLPLAPHALDEFVATMQAARSAPPLTRTSLTDTSFAMALDALLWQRGARWYALLPLRTDTSHDAVELAHVRAALAPLAASGVQLLSLKQATDALYGSYLHAAVQLSLAGLAGIVVLLLCVLRSVRRTARVLAPLLLAVVGVTAALLAAGTALTILHLIGLLLIVAVGSNYALFFDRRAAGHAQAELPLTLASLVVANLSTVIGFGTLALSQVPVLHALGVTVAPGTLLALWLSALLSPRALFRGRTADGVAVTP